MIGTARQPPPPAGHHRTSGGVLDPKSEMVVGYNKGGGVVSAVMTRTYYHRRCKKRKKILTNIESLPDEMVFEILIRIPARHIYEVTRLVCPKWYRMIHTPHFINEHLKQSTIGVFIQPPMFGGEIVFLSMREGSRNVEVSKYSYLFRTRVWTSCNGLVLMPDYKKYHVLYIANPATKQHFGLPPFMRCKMNFSFRLCMLAYVAATMEYKVVVTYNTTLNLDSPCFAAAILTVGVDDMWRHVRTDHLSCEARKLFNSNPFVTGGFIHWCDCEENRVVTLNVETETFREIHVPQGYGEERYKRFLPTESYLSFVTERSKFSWEVWEMKPETGEWTKLPDIDLEGEKNTIREVLGSPHCRLTPVAWLKYKEVMVFIPPFPSKVIFVYDVVHAHKIYHFETRGTLPGVRFVVHVNSLVWLDSSTPEYGR